MGLEEEVIRLTNVIVELTEHIKDVSFGSSSVVKEEPKGKKSRRTKAQIAADDKANLKEEKEAAKVDLLGLGEDFDPPVPPTPEIVITLDQLKAEASAVVNLDDSEDQKGLAKAQEIITAAGYKKISDIPEKARAEIVMVFREAVTSWNKK